MHSRAGASVIVVAVVVAISACSGSDGPSAGSGRSAPPVTGPKTAKFQGWTRRDHGEGQVQRVRITGETNYGDGSWRIVSSTAGLDRSEHVFVDGHAYQQVGSQPGKW